MQIFNCRNLLGTLFEVENMCNICFRKFCFLQEVFLLKKTRFSQSFPPGWYHSFLGRAQQGVARHCGEGLTGDGNGSGGRKCLRLSITEGGREGQSKVMASCSGLEEKFQECSNKRSGPCKQRRKHVTTGTKQFGAKVMARRRKCDVRFSMA